MLADISNKKGLLIKAENLGSNVNGFYVNGEIVLNKNINNPVLTVFTHELTHSMENTNEYESLKKAVFHDLKSNLNMSDIDMDLVIDEDLQEIIQSRFNFDGYEMSNEEAINEMVAQYIENNIDSEAFIKEVSGNKPLLQKIIDWLNEMIKHFTGTQQEKSYINLKNKYKAAYNSVSFTTDVSEIKLRKKYMLDKNMNQIKFDENSQLDNAFKIINMEPVIKLTDNKFEKNPTKDLVTMGIEFFNSIGNKAYNNILGDVLLDKQGIQSLIGHSPRYIDRYQAIEAIPNVIENGEILSVEDNWKGRGIDTAVITAPIKINDKLKYMSVVVSQNKQKNNYYLHELTILDQEYKKGSLRSLNKSHSNNGTDLNELTYNILNLAKKSTPQYSLNNHKYLKDLELERNVVQDEVQEAQLIIDGYGNNLGKKAIILNKVDLDGNPILVSVNEKTIKDRVFYDVNDIVSIHGRKNIQSTIAGATTIYKNNKSDNWLASHRLQLPSSASVITSRYSLSNNKNKSTPQYFEFRYFTKKQYSFISDGKKVNPN